MFQVSDVAIRSIFVVLIFFMDEESVNIPYCLNKMFVGLMDICGMVHVENMRSSTCCLNDAQLDFR